MKNHQLTVLALGSAVMGLALLFDDSDGQGARHRSVRSEAPGRQHRQEVIIERRFDVRPGGQLLVDLADGDALIESGGGGATVEVLAQAYDMDWARAVIERMRFDIRREGNRVIVEAEDPRIERAQWRQHRSVAVEVRIVVPARFDAEIRTGDGDVALSDLDGVVRIESSDGDIAVGTVTGPAIRLRTEDGDITAGSLEGDQIELHTQDGDIRARRVAGRLTAVTQDGDVALDLAEPRETSVRTGDGDIVLAVLGDFGFSVDLRGEDVVLGSGVSLEGTRHARSARGDVNGGGPRVAATTSDDGTILLRVER